jgi:hypothetical protein
LRSRRRGDPDREHRAATRKQFRESRHGLSLPVPSMPRQQRTAARNGFMSGELHSD